MLMTVGQINFALKIDLYAINLNHITAIYLF